MIGLEVEHRQRRRWEFRAHQRQVFRLARTREPGGKLRKARIVTDGEQRRDLVRRLPQNLDQMVDGRKINRILDQMRDMAWERLEHLVEGLLGATRIGGDGEARHDVGVSQILAHAPRILHPSTGERTLAVAAGRMPVGLAMAQEQELTHAASLSRRRRAATRRPSLNAGCDETTRLFTPKGAACKLSPFVFPRFP